MHQHISYLLRQSTPAKPSFWINNLFWPNNLFGYKRPLAFFRKDVEKFGYSLAIIV